MNLAGFRADVLSGPDHLHRDLATRLKELQEYRRPYRDAQAEPDLESFPPARRRAPDNLKASTTPTNKVSATVLEVTAPQSALTTHR